MSVKIERKAVTVDRTEDVTKVTIRPQRVTVKHSPVPLASGYYWVHEQAIPLTPWIVVHGFGRKPSAVAVTDLDDNFVEAEWQHLDTNRIEVRPLLPATGRVYLGA